MKTKLTRTEFDVLERIQHFQDTDTPVSEWQLDKAEQRCARKLFARLLIARRNQNNRVGLYLTAQGVDALEAVQS